MRFLLVLASVALASAASAQTIINTVPYTISASGKYRLGGNFVTASATQAAITISAPNVILDLGGFFVSGPGNSTTSTQSVVQVGNVSNVTIRNGTAANNGYGIRFAAGASSINHLVEDMNITRCLLVGISFQSDSASTVVRRCSISQIAGYSLSSTAFGIFCAAGVRIDNCFINTVVASGGNDGFGISQTSGSFAIGNTVSNCAFGIRFGKYKDNLTFNCATPFDSGIDAGGND